MFFSLSFCMICDGEQQEGQSTGPGSGPGEESPTGPGGSAALGRATRGAIIVRDKLGGIQRLTLVERGGGQARHEPHTFATASSKSSCVTCTRRSRKAYMPASVHVPCSGHRWQQQMMDESPPSAIAARAPQPSSKLSLACPGHGGLTFASAPDAPGISSAILRRLMPRVRFILREWMRRI